MDLINRKRNRLPNFDYSAEGYYFITICTFEKKNLLCEIVESKEYIIQINLSKLGEITKLQLFDIEKRFKNVTIDKYVIMPNHIHIIFKCNKNDYAPTLSNIVRAFKSLVTITYKKHYEIANIWQKSFYDHIIRDETDYLRICEYIESNPLKWSEDKYYVK